MLLKTSALLCALAASSAFAAAKDPCARNTRNVKCLAQMVGILQAQVAQLQGQLSGIATTPGPKGDKGDTGLTGPAGPMGPAGINGANGTDGVSGYEVFVEDIFRVLASNLVSTTTLFTCPSGKKALSVKDIASTYINGTFTITQPPFIDTDGNVKMTLDCQSVSNCARRTHISVVCASVP